MTKVVDRRYIENKLLFDDEKMFEFVFKAYFPRLMAFAGKFIADKTEVEDIIQEAFLKIWEKRNEIKADTFQSYLFTLVRNSCINHIKHQKIVNGHSIETWKTTKGEMLYYADFFDDPHSLTIYNEIQKEIETVMNQLPEQTRKVFQLSRFDGLKNKEIAEKLNITLRTVEKHNTKALRQFKTHFASAYLLVVTLFSLMKGL
ncbi:RNA polymerase sigma-70 factor, ECF subfamily [Mariniphaga anaerophila]|uniref:RNA polymerase sigma-70 factor, ECF subfamily n=1 Tax=Mariniphaga anaerophila TaxID=1484053 RepID=A0A1M4VVR2_9BACT|nr:RNA polymerase sigma-70 factor [Mariniphaga anaerophila]SHE73114.1 RNA polymerase sigma-70 factor, ECF subfamily [Mariniphaga anaerophila]